MRTGMVLGSGRGGSVRRTAVGRDSRPRPRPPGWGGNWEHGFPPLETVSRTLSIDRERLGENGSRWSRNVHRGPPTQAACYQCVVGTGFGLVSRKRTGLLGHPRAASSGCASAGHGAGRTRPRIPAISIRWSWRAGKLYESNSVEAIIRVGPCSRGLNSATEILSTMIQ